MRIILSLLFLFAFAISVAAQTNEAQKLDEFTKLPCDDLLARADAALTEASKIENAKIYLIYYEGAYTNYKTEIVNPVRGDALNFTKAISLYMTKWRKFPRERIVLVDGGYMKNYETEIWIVPPSAEPPRPTPSLEKKDIKFRKGKPVPVRDCEGYYRSI
jgi:hypothetical protein